MFIVQVKFGRMCMQGRKVFSKKVCRVAVGYVVQIVHMTAGTGLDLENLVGSIWQTLLVLNWVNFSSQT